jgi:hypothetical protein
MEGLQEQCSSRKGSVDSKHRHRHDDGAAQAGLFECVLGAGCSSHGNDQARRKKQDRRD